MKTEIEKPIVRTTQAGFSNTLTRLQTGMIVKFAGHECKIVMVNDCRARLVPLTRKAVKIETLGGKEVSFERPMEGYNVSPNAEVEIVGFDVEVAK